MRRCRDVSGVYLLLINARVGMSTLAPELAVSEVGMPTLWGTPR